MGHVARMEEQGNAYNHRDFMGKLEGKQPPGRFNRKFRDNIEMNLRELGRDKLEQFFFVLLIQCKFS